MSASRRRRPHVNQIVDLAITRYITRSVPAATVPAVIEIVSPNDPAVLEHRAVPVPAASIQSPAVGVGREPVAHVLAELPALGVLCDRDRLLAAAWLASLPSARTRRAYAGDLLGRQAWLAKRGLDVLGAGRVHVDLWARDQQAQGAGDASVRGQRVGQRRAPAV